MTDLDFQTDDFLALLSDALRAGPGSPQWHEAVVKLRAQGIAHADEHRLLLKAREHLESGKGYRSVRAGPEFTKKLLTAIDEESVKKSSSQSATTSIAVASAAVMLIVLLVIGYLLWNAADKQQPSQDVLTNIVSESDFAHAIPVDWHLIGKLPMRFDNGFGAADKTSGAGGGIVWNRAIAADESFAILATIKMHAPINNPVAEIFVTDDSQFSEDNGTTPHELVWLLQSTQAQVILPGGRVQAEAEMSKDFRGAIRMVIEGGNATIYIGDKRMWSGTCGLDPARPRYVGLRFLHGEGDSGGSVVFQSVRINMRPQ